jgi:hypothetical protein
MTGVGWEEMPMTGSLEGITRVGRRLARAASPVDKRGTRCRGRSVDLVQSSVIERGRLADLGVAMRVE